MNKYICNNWLYKVYNMWDDESDKILIIDMKQQNRIPQKFWHTLPFDLSFYKVFNKGPFYPVKARWRVLIRADLCEDVRQKREM